MSKERIFKVLKTTIPQDVLIIELTLKEFTRLAAKEDFSPLFQNDQGLFYIDPENRIMFFAQKRKVNNA